MNTLVGHSKLTLTAIEDLVQAMPVKHHFSDKVYVRELFMPKGLFVVGKTHKTRHLNVVLTGECDVMINGVVKHIKAPYTFESLEGSQKTLYIYEDCLWQTIHVNEDDETDLEKLEDRYIDANDEQPLAFVETIKQLTNGGN